VAGNAHAFVNLLADNGRISRSTSRCATHRRFGEFGTTGITHIGNRTLYFIVGQVSRATLGRHGIEALQRMLGQHIPTLGNTRAPGTGITKLGRTSQTLTVTGNTDGLEHLLASTHSRRGIANLGFTHRFQTSGNSLLGHDFGINVVTTGRQLGQQPDRHYQTNNDANQDLDDLTGSHSVLITHSSLA
jgi:hypothetical protein